MRPSSNSPFLLLQLLKGFIPISCKHDLRRHSPSEYIQENGLDNSSCYRISRPFASFETQRKGFRFSCCTVTPASGVRSCCLVSHLRLTKIDSTLHYAAPSLSLKSSFFEPLLPPPRCSFHLVLPLLPLLSRLVAALLSPTSSFLPRFSDPPLSSKRPGLLLPFTISLVNPERDTKTLVWSIST